MKTKVIAGVVALLVLAGAWFLGGTPEVVLPNESPASALVYTPEPSVFVAEPEVVAEPTQEPVLISEPEDEVEDVPEPEATPVPEIIPEPTPTPAPETTTPEATPAPIPTPTPTLETPPTPAPEPTPTPEPTPEPEPTPTPTPAVNDDGSFTVTLEIRVDMLVHNLNLLHRDKHELVPYNGIIFPRTEVTAHEGESVFNVLQREMRRHRMHMASRFTPVLNSAYVEAINNIYEFDAGPLSGWVYRVNGTFPHMGSSRYLVNPGDEIQWHFSLDLGRDVGAVFADGEGQLDD